MNILVHDMIYLIMTLSIFNKAVKRVYIHCLLLYNQHAASTERDWNEYVHFQHSTCFLYCHGAHN